MQKPQLPGSTFCGWYIEGSTLMQSWWAHLHPQSLQRIQNSVDLFLVVFLIGFFDTIFHQFPSLFPGGLYPLLASPLFCKFETILFLCNTVSWGDFTSLWNFNYHCPANKFLQISCIFFGTGCSSRKARCCFLFLFLCFVNRYNPNSWHIMIALLKDDRGHSEFLLWWCLIKDTCL